MKQNDQTIQNNDPNSSALWPQKWVKLSLIIAIFVMVLATVFLLSNRMAANNSTGFPNFQDSHFELFDQNDELRRPDDFVGRPIALFFGFTYCPDVCPTTLLQLTSALDQVANRGQSVDNLQILFITVDPERDTPSQLNSYLNLFDAKVIGLTGADANIEATLQHFGVYAEKTGSGDDYLYDHSAAIYLYRPDGSFKGTVVHNEPLEFIIKKLSSLLK